ncbi:MAG: class A beta-lactamase, subclass A2 [Janthinobacterium lividum]
MLKAICYTFLFYILSGFNGFAQSNSLKSKIDLITKDAKGTVAVSVVNFETRNRFAYNATQHLPMQSVMKFPIAITVLHEIDEGRFTLDQLIPISKEDLPRTYSPLRDKYPEGGVAVSIGALLSYMVSLSDNNACDILLKTIGGTEKVNAYIHSLGVKNIAIKASEFEMAQAWNVQFTNWCDAEAITQLLDLAFQPDFLSKANHAYLWKILQETSTGPNQIKGLLPASTIVAHKTGRSDTNEQGIAAATNDVGMITLPNGKHLIIAIFISNSPVNLAVRESVIARIAKAAYDEVALN